VCFCDRSIRTKSQHTSRYSIIPPLISQRSVNAGRKAHAQPRELPTLLYSLL
jgi:hypothetical protein